MSNISPFSDILDSSITQYMANQSTTQKNNSLKDNFYQFD